MEENIDKLLDEAFGELEYVRQPEDSDFWYRRPNYATEDDECDRKTDFKLIGEVVTDFAIDSYKIWFKLEDGRVYECVVAGDCCSHSYFAEVVNLKSLISGSAIKDIVDMPLMDQEKLKTNGREMDVGYLVQVYGAKIYFEDKKLKPTIISFRNASNGYYGGSMLEPRLVHHFPEQNEITDDWVGI